MLRAPVDHAAALAAAAANTPKSSDGKSSLCIHDIPCLQLVSLAPRSSFSDHSKKTTPCPPRDHCRSSSYQNRVDEDGRRRRLPAPFSAAVEVTIASSR
mmetsp:Transcript_3927/g.8083  ORF Transcript_3927/g.8083 Transcript_3927/m.8083 type:complete len:99 (+) Transcript_3927:221-517(+)